MARFAMHPVNVVLHQGSGRLELLWSDGECSRLSGQRLRQACRCAGCEKLRRAQHDIPAAADTAVTNLQPVGDVGLQLFFNDGHDRGIFPWAYLHELGQHEQPV